MDNDKSTKITAAIIYFLGVISTIIALVSNILESADHDGGDIKNVLIIFIAFSGMMLFSYAVLLSIEYNLALANVITSVIAFGSILLEISLMPVLLGIYGKHFSFILIISNILQLTCIVILAISVQFISVWS